jgi:hypothetical protein
MAYGSGLREAQRVVEQAIGEKLDGSPLVGLIMNEPKSD